MGYCVPTDEQETVISFGRNERAAYIYTSDQTVMTKLDKLVNTSSYYSLAHVGKVDGSIVDKQYVVSDKSLICFRGAKRTGQPMTEEQKQKMREGREAKMNNA